MFRKLLCYVVLAAMTLHCSSRLGVLSFVVEKRQTIAYSLGLIAEIPIAMCNVDYDFSGGLKIQDSDAAQGVPYFAPAQEINLFIVATVQLNSLPVVQTSDKYAAFLPTSPTAGQYTLFSILLP